MWHWITVHMSMLLAWMMEKVPHFYELLGGALIFGSSAVTETRLPKTRRKCQHWIWFGVFSILFALAGVGVRYGELRQNKKISDQADQDRGALQQNRQHMDDRITEVLRSNHETYVRLDALQTQNVLLFKGLGQVIVKNDPRQVRELIDKAHVLQQGAGPAAARDAPPVGSSTGGPLRTLSGMFIGHREIVAFLLYRSHADKPTPLLRRWILALYYHKLL